MKTYLSIITLLIALLFPLSIHADTFCVSDATALQTALTNASGNGEDDTIQIVQGTYVGSFIYASTEAFNLTVEGGYTEGCASRVVDPTNTVLDANNSGQVLVLSCTVNANFIIEGLTLQNGNETEYLGGGLFLGVNGGSVELTNNNISYNYCRRDGGGIYIDMVEDIVLANNTITFNDGGDGAGVFINSPTNVTFENNTISHNGPSGTGTWLGGIRILNPSGEISLRGNTISYNTGNSGCTLIEGASVVTVDNNTISHNSGSSGDGNGVGIYIISPTVIFENNTVHDNHNGNSGGGVYLDATTITVTKNTINNNSSESGGGIYLRGTEITLENNLIFNNQASQIGGGVTIGGIPASMVTITNNTVYNNSAGLQGGGVRLFLSEDDAQANIFNNIVWNNISPQGADLYIRNDGNGNYFPSTVNLFNNDFDQSADGTYIQLPFTIDPSNLDNEDPLFVNASSGNFHLTDSSPCIGAGRLEGAPEDDMDGDARPFGNAVDIGADEHIGMCKGNFDFDNDVDGTDASLFKSHFGRSTFKNPCPPDGPAPAEQTGQTTSYATGDDGEHQSGVPFPEPRFVDNEDGTVKDNLTGLIWLKDANCFGQRAWADAISDCNGLASGSCGLTDGSSAGDWRLPNKKELISLTHDGYYDPALPNTAGTGQWSEGDPFNNVQSNFYCSSTSYVLDTSHAWNVYMRNGGLDEGGAKFNHNYVWPVRGGH